MTAGASVRRLAFAGAAGLAAAGAFWGAYLNLVGVAAATSLRRERDPRRSTPGQMRFRLLVPAHDEEAHIGATLDSMAALDYDQTRVEVHVIADNCGDETAAIARAHGVHVHERFDLDRPGKGAALAWLIDRLPPGGDHDAIVVIDADTIVDPDLLTAFEHAFAGGSPAIQGHYTVKDAATGGDVGFRSAAFAVRHLARPEGRTALGGSSSLYGNGMAFRDPIARAYQWSNTLTEDLEMGLRLLLDGHHVGFASDAVVAAEMPTGLADAASQNERWEAGRLMIARHFVPRLLAAAKRRAHGVRWPYIDAAIDISMPPLTTVVAGSTLAGVAAAGLGRGRTRNVGVATALVAVGLQGLHVVHALRMAEAHPASWRSLARTPIHIVWKSRLLARVVRRRPGSWIRTRRQSGPVAA